MFNKYWESGAHGTEVAIVAAELPDRYKFMHKALTESADGRAQSCECNKLITRTTEQCFWIKGTRITIWASRGRFQNKYVYLFLVVFACFIGSWANHLRDQRFTKTVKLKVLLHKFQIGDSCICRRSSFFLYVFQCWKLPGIEDVHDLSMYGPVEVNRTWDSMSNALAVTWVRNESKTLHTHTVTRS